MKKDSDMNEILLKRFMELGEKEDNVQYFSHIENESM